MAALQGEWLYERFGTNIALPAITARTMRALCLSEIGEFAEGITYGDEALRLADVIDRPYEHVVTSYRVGDSYLRQGHLSKAIPLLERGVALRQDAEMRAFAIHAAALLAMAYIWSGRVAQTSPLLEQFLVQVLDQTPCRIDVVLLCSEAYLSADHVAEASQLVQRALVHTREHKEQGYQARALWLLGEIATRHDPPGGKPATAHYRQALTLAAHSACLPPPGPLPPRSSASCIARQGTRIRAQARTV